MISNDRPLCSGKNQFSEFVVDRSHNGDSGQMMLIRLVCDADVVLFLCLSANKKYPVLQVVFHSLVLQEQKTNGDGE